MVFGRNRCRHTATIQRNLLWRSSEWSEQRLRLHGLRAGQCVTQHAGQSVARNVRSLFCWQNKLLFCILNDKVHGATRDYVISNMAVFRSS